MNTSNPPASHDKIRQTDTITLYRPALTPLKPTTPTNNSNSNSNESPHLIILCSWFRALPKHTAKYVETHRTLHPYAQILLIDSVVGDMLHTSYNTQQKRLSPAVELIAAFRAADANASILLHFFSDGGCNSAVQLAEAWRATHTSPLPVTAMAFDSCPGSPSLVLAGKATVLSAPPAARWYFTFVVWLVIVPLYAMPHLLGQGNIVTLLRERLNDPLFFPIGARRVYFCSPADELVMMEDVVGHFESARATGYETELVEFRRSAHVAHVMEDEGRYWGAVGGL